MRTNFLKKSVGGFILGLSLLGIGLMSGTTAQAQYRTQDQYRRERYEQEQYRRAQQEAYRRAQEEAYRRAQEEAYRRAQQQQQYGRDDWWNQNQRRGRRNRDNYANYGGSFDLRQTALNAGYNEGMKEGRRDRNDRNRYDFRDESAYQRASTDYSSRLGDRYIYQRYFRDAFERGYADGYQGY